ncbi:hypothetical protein [Streptomyces albipurpureus]|uniref:Uncharacterized protein n=1 Tax=Streptomyces albipurpureus TaxID=2897419 RepID=A0ABT0UZI5_9ACTN|nr:hypothetical protein [Streptomyces sp. CWNU-1]MCM2392723.1 hypothetical protein [Streptomyces sp. CWNU-1]
MDLCRVDGTLAGVCINGGATAVRAEALQQALRARGVDIQVSATASYLSQLKIIPGSVEAMTRLTDLVWQEMPEPHRAAFTAPVLPARFTRSPAVPQTGTRGGYRLMPLTAVLASRGHPRHRAGARPAFPFLSEMSTAPWH